MSKTSISAASEAMPRRSTPEYAAAWGKCRQLGKELSLALAETGDQEFAFIQPAGNEFAVGFGQLQSDTRHPIDYPAQTITRMAERISFAMNDDPDMFVERVCITPQGIYMQAKVTGGSDPLAETIEAYNVGVAKFNAIPSEQITIANEQSLVEATYGPAWDRILEWNEPALTRQGAIAALTFMGEQDVFMDDCGEPLRLAVLRFLEAM